MDNYLEALIEIVKAAQRIVCDKAYSDKKTAPMERLITFAKIVPSYFDMQRDLETVKKDLYGSYEAGRGELGKVREIAETLKTIAQQIIDEADGILRPEHVKELSEIIITIQKFIDESHHIQRKLIDCPKSFVPENDEKVLYSYKQDMEWRIALAIFVLGLIFTSVAITIGEDASWGMLFVIVVVLYAFSPTKWIIVTDKRLIFYGYRKRSVLFSELEHCGILRTQSGKKVSFKLKNKDIPFLFNEDLLRGKRLIASVWYHLHQTAPIDFERVFFASRKEMSAKYFSEVENELSHLKNVELSDEKVEHHVEHHEEEIHATDGAKEQEDNQEEGIKQQIVAKHEHLKTNLHSYNIYIDGAEKIILHHTSPRRYSVEFTVISLLILFFLFGNVLVDTGLAFAGLFLFCIFGTLWIIVSRSFCKRLSFYTQQELIVTNKRFIIVEKGKDNIVIRIPEIESITAKPDKWEEIATNFIRGDAFIPQDLIIRLLSGESHKIKLADLRQILDTLKRFCPENWEKIVHSAR